MYNIHNFYPVNHKSKEMIFKRFLPIILILLTINGWSSNAYKDSLVNNVFVSIYNQRFDQAEEMLTQYRIYIDPFYAEVLNIDLHWWKYSSTRSKEDAKNLTSLLNTSEYASSNIQQSKINQLIKKSYELRYERKRYNLIRVVVIRSQINELLDEINNDQLTISGDQLKLFDLYTTMFMYFSNVNPFTVKSGNSQQKNYLIQMGHYTMDDDLILNTMAHYFLGRIYQKVKKDASKGKMHFEVLTSKFPDNKLFAEYLEDCERKI